MFDMALNALVCTATSFACFLCLQDSRECECGEFRCPKFCCGCQEIDEDYELPLRRKRIKLSNIQCEKLDEFISNDCCAICCDGENTDNLRQLPCSHIYHDECIHAWYYKCPKSNVHCPLCMNKLQLEL